MSRSIDRRGFCKCLGIGAAVGAGWVRTGLGAATVAKGAPNAEKLGWRLACQAYSFNRFTFYEAVEKNASLGLHYIEAYPGQRLTGEKPDLKLNDTLPPEVRLEVKKRLADAGVKMVNFGVTRLPNDEAACRKTFDFAKDMGIETIVSEPPADAFDLLDRLCGEYGINVALHNHPAPSPYWNPDTVLAACQGRSRRIGSCADTGHWMRSGVNPLEALRKLEGRIISFHFKDLNKMGDGTRRYSHEEIHDVPWGTGQADVKALLKEIYRQKIKAVFAIEYEWNWLESLPEIAQSVVDFDKVAAERAGQG